MKFLDHIYFINLEKRIDRLAEFNTEMAKMDLKATRFNAIYHPYGIIGCTQSHLAILKLAKEQQLPYVLIMEDDFTFLVDKPTLYQQIQYLIDYENNENNTFDVCMFSYNIQNSKPIENTHFIKILEAQTASGYLVMPHYYDKLINLYEDAIPKLETTRQHWIYANDQIWKQLQQQDNWIAFAIRIGKQRISWTDLGNAIADYEV